MGFHGTSMYEVAITRLQATSNDLMIKRQAVYFATAEVAGTLLEEIYQEIGLGSMNATDVVNEMWNECVSLNKTQSLDAKALMSFMNFFTTNSLKYCIHNDEIPKTPMAGMWFWETDEYIDCDSKIMRKLLVDDGFDKPTAIFQIWRNNKLIETSTGELCKTVSHIKDLKGKKGSTYVVRINKNMISGYLGHEDIGEETPHPTSTQETINYDITLTDEKTAEMLAAWE